MFVAAAGAFAAMVGYRLSMTIPMNDLDIILLGIAVVCCMAGLIDTVMHLFLRGDNQAMCVEAFGKRGSEVWDIGGKAIYAASVGRVQTSVSLESPESETRPLAEILSGIRSRIA